MPGNHPPSRWLVWLALPVPFLVNSTPFFRDSPEFCVSLAEAGIPHPTGFPAIHVLAQLFTWIPIGSLSYRVTLFVGLCAVAAVAMMVSTAMYLAATSPQRRHSPGVIALVLAGGGGVLLMNTLFYHWTNVEVYIPTLAMIAALLRFSVSLLDDPDWIQRVPLWGLLAGFSTGFHITAPMVALLLSLVMAVHWIAGSSWKTGTLMRFLPGVGFAVAGVLVLAYLPMRAAAQPPLNWGDPSSAHALLQHLSGASIRRSFAQDMWASDFAKLLYNGGVYLSQLVQQAASVMPLALLGWVLLMRRPQTRTAAALILLVLLADAAFSILVNPMAQSDLQTSTLSLLILGLMGLTGALTALQHLCHLGEPGSRRTAFTAILSGVAVVMMLWSPATSMSVDARVGRQAPAAYGYYLEALRQTPAEGIISTCSDDMSGMLLYADSIEHRRPDVLPVIQQMLCTPSLMDPLVERHPSHPGTSALVGSTEQWCRMDSARSMVQTWEQLLRLWDDLHGVVVWELGESRLSGLSRPGENAILAFFHRSRGTGADQTQTAGDVRGQFSRFRDDWGSPGLDEIGGQILSDALRLQASEFQRRSRSRGTADVEACEMLRRAVSLDPSNGRAWNNLSVCLLGLGHLPEATEAARTAVGAVPFHLSSRSNLILLLFLTDRNEDAARQLVAMMLDFPPDQVRDRLSTVQHSLEQLNRPVAVAMIRDVLSRLPPSTPAP